MNAVTLTLSTFCERRLALKAKLLTKVQCHKQQTENGANAMHVVTTGEVVGWMNDVTHQYIQSIFGKWLKIGFSYLENVFHPASCKRLFVPGSD